MAAFRRGDLARARALAKAQIDAEQGPPDVHHLLGLIECREGRLEAGIGYLRSAVDAQPDNIAFRVMLGRALADAARPQEALDVAIPPKDASPAGLALWHVRAEAAQAAGDHAAAAEAWKILCAARPDDWRGWANYGEALAGLERWEDAASALRRGWTLNPNELPIQQNLVSALVHAGLFDQAADQLRSMLDAGLGDIGVRLLLSRLLADLGRHRESMAELDKASRQAVGESASADAPLIRIALGERNDTSAPVSEAEHRALRELALLLERTNRMDALRALLDDAEAAGILREELAYAAAATALRDGNPDEAQRLLAFEPGDRDVVRQHRLMARILDARGDFAGAFAATEAMNRSVDDFEGWRARGAEYRRRLRLLAEATIDERLARLRPLAQGPRPSPAFLVGFPRSGTTLLDTFLMGHPDTQVLEEFPMLAAAEDVVGKVGDDPIHWRGRLEPARQAYFAELHRHIDPGSPGLIIDKMPLNMLRLLLMYCLFPKAQVIFAQRHPCDCVLSGFMQSFTLNDAMACFLTIEDSADLYDAAMTLFIRNRDMLPIAVHTLVYEELVADPEAALKPLIAFLGLEWRPELLDHRSTARARGAIITPSYDQVVQPLSKAPTGRWRRYEKQLEPVLPVLLPWAERLGYAN